MACSIEITDIEAGYGDWDEHDLQGALNIPITDTFAARVAFDHVDRDSFYNAWMNAEHTVRTPGHLNDIDHDSGRVKLRWQPNDSWDVKVSYDHNVLDNHGYAFTVVNGTPATFPGFPPPTDIPTNISKNPFVVGISWSSPCRIPEVLCVAGTAGTVGTGTGGR